MDKYENINFLQISNKINFLKMPIFDTIFINLSNLNLSLFCENKNNNNNNNDEKYKIIIMSNSSKLLKIILKIIKNILFFRIEYLNNINNNNIEFEIKKLFLFEEELNQNFILFINSLKNINKYNFFQSDIISFFNFFEE